MDSVEKKSEKIKFRAMGTDIFLEIVPERANQAKKAIQDLNATKKIFLEKEKIFSRFDPASEICRLNENLGIWQETPEDILRLAGRILEYNKISGGLFDPRVIDILEQIGYDRDFQKLNPENQKTISDFEKIVDDLAEDLKLESGKIFFGRRMDFSGVAKGYITDRVAEFLKKRGWKNFLVNSGGDIFAAGKNSEEKDWKVEVEGVAPQKMTLRISERGVANSGISRKKWKIGEKKFHHLVNPKDPNHYSSEIQTVAVIEKSAEEADGRAKTLVLMGKKEGLRFAEKNKIAAFFLDFEDNISFTPEAKKYILSKY